MAYGNEHMAQDSFRPLTEGYQPGSQILQKGYSPVLSSATPATPPRGGSSVAKPAQAAAPDAMPKS